MRSVVFVITAMIAAALGNVAHASDIVATLLNGNTISFPYCWKRGNEIRFDAPGGTVGLNTADIKTIEERLFHADTDAQYLLATAVPVRESDPIMILRDFMAKKRGISISVDKDIPAKSKSPLAKKAQTGDVELIAPVTKVIESYVQALKGPKGESILFGFFVNSREELEGRKCSIKFLDIDRKVLHVQGMTVARVSLSKESSQKVGLSSLSYLIYTLVPGNVEFWGYDVVCDTAM